MPGQHQLHGGSGSGPTMTLFRQRWASAPTRTRTMTGQYRGASLAVPLPNHMAGRRLNLPWNTKRSHAIKGVSIQIMAGLEADTIGTPPNSAGPFEGGPNNLEEADVCNPNGPMEDYVGPRASELNIQPSLGPSQSGTQACLETTPPSTIEPLFSL